MSKNKEFTIVIGNKNYSSWSLRPWLVLKQCSVEFDEIVIPLRQPDSKEKILKHSPSGKVPLLKHNNFIVWESLAIAEYLAELFPKKNLWPKDQKARAWARAVSSEMHGGFVHLRKNMYMNIRANFSEKGKTAESLADISRIKQIWEDCRTAHQSNGNYLFGDFSIADAMFAPVLFRFKTYGVKLSGLSQKYLEGMLNVPAMKEWQAAAQNEPYSIPEIDQYK